jgi:hypothetical protein
MKFNEYIRKPFTIEALEITRDNIKSVTKLLGGTLCRNDGVTFISLDHPSVPGIDRAYLGWFLTKLDGTYRVYAPKPFRSQFIEKTRFGNAGQEELDKMFEQVEPEKDPTPPHGIERPVSVD